MSLPPALLQRLAQRGLVQKPKLKERENLQLAAAENEEVIAEDYDELEGDDAPQSQEEYQYPSQYDNDVVRKSRTEENFWLERIKARMGEASSAVGYKGCPNKYNIWHKCTLFCVNRWSEGKPEPSREYMRRFKRLLRKYPLPKGWSEMYDSGCGCYFFYSAADNLVSWLPPTHPKSQVTKSAAVYRRQLEEAAGDSGGGGSDGEQHMEDSDEREESGETRYQREIDDIINASMRPRPTTPTLALMPQNFPTLEETSANVSALPRKQKSRDLDRALARQRRDRDKDRERSGYGRRHGRGDNDPVDPMDPSAYSDIPRGKWSDGLHTGGDERKKLATSITTDDGLKRGGRERRNIHSDDENDHEYD